MGRIGRPADRWTTWLARAVLRFIRNLLAVLATLLLIFSWPIVSELRLGIIQARHRTIAKNLVARHADRKAIASAFSEGEGIRIVDLPPDDWRSPYRPAIVAIDANEFSFVVSTAHVETTIILDRNARALAYRIGTGGSAP